MWEKKTLKPWAPALPVLSRTPESRHVIPVSEWSRKPKRFNLNWGWRRNWLNILKPDQVTAKTREQRATASQLQTTASVHDSLRVKCGDEFSQGSTSASSLFLFHSFFLSSSWGLFQYCMKNTKVTEIFTINLLSSETVNQTLFTHHLHSTIPFIWFIHSFISDTCLSCAQGRIETTNNQSHFHTRTYGQFLNSCHAHVFGPWEHP